MDIRWANDDKTDALCIEDEDCNVDFLFEQERCGICIDVVIDRGVLDCCEHWFCFACIDNWAAITNLCPICKIEFHRITCLPVYDTIGSTILDEHPISRSEDWSLQEKNNTLSFPSYYISEDAVKCLENDGCKMRDAMQAAGDDLSFDTSIACDSCDIWYHAYCVGFNPEFTYESSWLCPRCVNNEVLHKSGTVALQSVLKCPAPLTSEIGWTVDPSLSGRVSVSVADAGETAVVVSMIDGDQKGDYERRSFDSLDSTLDIELANSLLCSDIENSGTDLQIKDRSSIQLSQNSLFVSDYKAHRTDLSEVDSRADLFFDVVSPEIIDFQAHNDLKETVVSSYSLDYAVITPRIDTTKSHSEPTTLHEVPFAVCNSEANDKKNINAQETSNSVYSDGYMDTYSVACDSCVAKDEKDSKSSSIIDTCLLASSSSLDVTVLKPVNGFPELQSEPTRLHEVPFSVCYSDASDKKNTINVHETSESAHSDGYMDTISVVCGTFVSKNEGNNNSSGVIDTYVFASSSSSEDNMVTSCNEDMAIVSCQKNSEACNTTAKIKMNKTCTKNVNDNVNCIRKREPEAVYPVKKIKFDRKSRTSTTENLPALPAYKDSQVCSGQNKDGSLSYARQEEAEAPNIMSIVQESDCTFHVMPTVTKNANKFVDIKNNACGLRVKKIMRRVAEKGDSSVIAHKLGKEIREVSQQKDLKCIGKNDIDERLLAAFRAASVRSQTELKKRSELALVGTKNPLLLKGKKRENLTKKIYGTFGGRRRHAWTRDLEIEFWRHRCRKLQPDKVETLQSVLELLKKATNPHWNGYIERDSRGETADSILSRVYIADVSLFPRKNDIKPLSALSGSSQLDNITLNEQKSSRSLAEGPLNEDKNSMKNSIQNFKNLLQHNVTLSNNVEKNIQAPCFPKEAHSSGSNLSKESIVTSKQDSCPFDAKTDKRKWALEVLARKTVLSSLDASKAQEDNTLFREKYPLLAQLPSDMRPVLASTCYKKVSASVRQAQLYRITEHYLRRANVSVVRRTAETELALADAVNVEKDIFERSNSKLVYMNLCSQAVSQITNKPESAEANVSESANTALADTEADEKLESAGTDFGSASTVELSCEANSDTKAGGWSSVEEALKMAGLFSDSPPSSPDCATKYSIDDASTHENLIESLNYGAQSDVLHALDTREADDCIKVEAKPTFDISKSLKQQKEGVLENSKAVPKMPSSDDCEGVNEEHQKSQISDKNAEPLKNPPIIVEDENLDSAMRESCCILNDGAKVSVIDDAKSCCSNNHLDAVSADRENSETLLIGNLPNNPVSCDHNPNEEISKLANDKSDLVTSISKKVEAYIKEHIRPLFKIGVITSEQYRWAVGKTLDKVMKFHHKAKNANFLIREGDKVKKLAEQYAEAAQKKGFS